MGGRGSSSASKRAKSTTTAWQDMIAFDYQLDRHCSKTYYHFGRNNDAKAEAEFFRNNTRNYEHHGIPILDWERGQSIAWVNAFVEHYHALTGIWPWVYGNAWRFNQGTVNTNCGRLITS